MELKIAINDSFLTFMPPWYSCQLFHTPQWCCDVAAELGLKESYFNMLREVLMLK